MSDNNKYVSYCINKNPYINNNLKYYANWKIPWEFFCLISITKIKNTTWSRKLSNMLDSFFNVFYSFSCYICPMTHATFWCKPLQELDIWLQSYEQFFSYSVVQKNVTAEFGGQFSKSKYYSKIFLKFDICGILCVYGVRFVANKASVVR